VLLDVAFTPSEVQDLDHKVCIVIDVIRSTSTLAVIMSKEPGIVLLTPTVQKAVKHAGLQASHPLLCGERGGVAPEGFDHGNSPREYLDLDLEGKNIIFTSSNGTRAVADVSLAPHVYLGSFLNAQAVTEAALTSATRDKLDILLVCAGREEKFAVDDAHCAGFLLSRILGMIPASKDFTVADGGQAALAVYGYYRDAGKLYAGSGAGRTVIERGLGEDIEFLLQQDLYSSVPTLVRRDQKRCRFGFGVLL
jgi:2-phosphosulfolactate phosphatase